MAVVHLPFGGGLDEKTAAQWLDPEARVAAAVDGNYTHERVIEKRRGMGAVFQHGAAGGFGEGGRVVSTSRCGDIVALTPTGFAAYVASAATTSPLMGAAGFVPAVQVTRRPIVTVGSSAVGSAPSVPQVTEPPVLCDVPVANGTIRLAVYAGPATSGGNGTLYATAYDVSSNATIVPPTRIYTGAATNSVAWPIAAVYLDGAADPQSVAIFVSDSVAGFGSALWALNFSTSSLAFTGPRKLLTGSSWIANFDVSPIFNDGVGAFVVAYSDTTTRWSYVVFHPDFSIARAATQLNVAPTSYVCGDQIYVYALANDYVWFVYVFVDPGGGISTTIAYVSAVSASTFAHVFDQLLVTRTSLVLVPPVVTESGQAWLGWVVPQGNGSGGQMLSWSGIWEVYSAPGADLVMSGTIPLGVFPTARPISVERQVYLPAILNLYAGINNGFATPSGGVQSAQNTIYLVAPVLSADGAMLPVATVAPRQVDGSYVAQRTENGALGTAPWIHVPFVSAPFSDSIDATFSVGVRTLGSEYVGSITSAAAPTTPTWDAAFALSAPLLYQTTELGQELHVAAGLPLLGDGQQLFEDSFVYYPEFSIALTGGGGLPLTGAYQYAVVYAYQDAAGLLHRSAPSFTAIVNPVSSGCDVLYLPLSMTWRDALNPGNVFAEIYRTLAGGSTLYLVDRVQASGTGATSYLQYVDTTSDAQLATSTILYTTGDVLDQVNPPAALLQWVHKSRNFIVDETGRNVWFTQQFQAGLAPGYNESLTFTLPDQGVITAGISMDAEIVIFKSNAIWVVYGGDGPNQLGQGSDLTTPQRVPSDVGAVDWRGVVLTPVGIMFVAASGIYLLDRSLQVTFVGKSVLDTFARYPVCVAATLVPSATQVRFAMTDETDSTAILLVYDYLLGEWLTHTRPQQGSPICASVYTMGSGRYVELTSDGNLWEEHAATDATAYQDDSRGVVSGAPAAPHFVSTSVTTAWVKLQGLAGDQQARAILAYADTLDPCGLTVSIAVNYDTTIVQTNTWTASELAGSLGTSGAVAQTFVGALYNRQAAIQITLADVADTASVTGQGMQFASVALDILPVAGMFKNVGQRSRR